jgi:NAD-dependent deacetylase
MKKIVVLSGAGISQESGLQTFRDKGGLWDKYDFMKLASPEGWTEDPKLVLEFYNVRRKFVRDVNPNEAHQALVNLEEKYDVTIITQNVDDLHERAGSKNVLHLHGEIKKARSTANPNLVYDLGGKDIEWGDTCEEGSQLRPHIVWFGESVDMIGPAINIASSADIFIVVGTGLTVYPAASLIAYVPKETKKFIIDKKIPEVASYSNMTFIEKTAASGIPELVKQLLSE